MQGEFWIVNSDSSLENYLDDIRKQYNHHKYLMCQIKTGQQRSELQNNALHKYCEMVAEALNDAGLDMRQVIREDVDIPWSKNTVKEHLWRPIQLVMTKHKSTTKPKRGEYTEIYETLSRHLASKFGIDVPWPSKDRV